MKSAQLFQVAKRALSTTVVAAGLLTTALVANATTVQIQTVMGNFEVNLFDKDTPETVENFLAYVTAGAYTDSIVHRTVPQFIVQGGGFKYTGSVPPVAIPQNPAVINEPVFSNVRGTIAMAKLGDNPNSATNQWFININNNSANLDNQNGGFTVFGQVTGNGMAIVDSIAALSRYNLGGAFNETPLRNYTAGTIDEDHLVIVTGIVVLDPSPNTADSLNPIRRPSSSSSSSSSSSGINQGGSKGGGSVSMSLPGMLFMFGLLLAHGVRRRRKI